MRGGGGWISSERATSSYDLVEQMYYLYARVVKAKDLPTNPVTGSRDPYIEVKLGNYKGKTQHFEKRTGPECKQVIFDMNEVPTRVPPDSPLAPQWYRLEDRRGDRKGKGEIMLAVWMGTQADEAFPEAWHSDAASVYGGGVFSVRSKVYVVPKLWYQSQCDQSARSGITRQKPAPTAEPFEEQLVLTVENKLSPAKDELVGRASLPLTNFERRLDHWPVHSQWFNFQRFGFGALEGDKRHELKFSTRVHLRVCLEGAYHVLDESTMYISDTRPTARQLWKQPIGILEVGILSAQGLLPVKTKDGRGTTDAYCVAKYGLKWVRTRTIIDSFSPKWNEQYTWEVYDPCTVITLGVFDHCHLGRGETPGAGKDSRIRKVRIRLSTLETDRIYTHSYPLLVLQPSGLKKMGELQLAFRFTCLSLAHIIYLYGHPLPPKMHYLRPFTVNQLGSLRYQAMNIVAVRLGRAEPPLRKEVVEYMLDVDSHMWSMRRSKANFFRIMSPFSGIISMSTWLGELILPTIFLYTFLIGIWNFRFRPRHPPHMDTKLSWAEVVNPDELDEEFDTFPTSKQQDVVRMRYDRIRSVAGRFQTVVGDMATRGERFQALLSWRDPRASNLFIVFCLCTAITLT
ncbi:FT-interacting protein [Actinidia chinensis var. chinensis]|uniref:FT-interacting protein n=1 Tax=Actinidia chinensis var. chinensis TaxID=1590841 RepID=A0A2R6R571_ACTCC|nr:FT-interacting protein [Actinidia chinensis var. chinensis]